MPGSAYDEALDYLFSVTDYEKMRHVRYNADTFSLDRMQRLLEMLGSPHRRLRAVHVAGTKGKGSTAAMVHAMAAAAGLKAGLYTSPHLIDIRERIRVGHQNVPPEALACLVEDARPAAERLRARGDPPTFFEIITALAFMHFARQAVDLAVVEVGLGGRLDATNVLVPDVSVITALSMDHTEQLGPTLESIAREKAGIVKPAVPVVSQPQDPAALAVIQQACRSAGSPLVLLGRDVTYSWAPAARTDLPGVGSDRLLAGRVTIRTPAAAYADVMIPLMGEHQAMNAAAAVAASELTPVLAHRLTADLVRKAIGGVRWPGRMQYVPSSAGLPEILLDGAHNRASIERLLEGLSRHFPGRRMVFVFAAAADKDIDGMLAVLASRAAPAPVVFTQTASPRAAAPEDLLACFARHGGRAGQTCASAADAVGHAAALAAGEALVVVCGSLYLVGEVLTMIDRGCGC